MDYTVSHDILPLTFDYDLNSLAFRLSPHCPVPLSLHLLVDGRITHTAHMTTEIKGDVSVHVPESFILDDVVLTHDIAVQVAYRVLGTRIGEPIPISPMDKLSVRTFGSVVQVNRKVEISKFTCSIEGLKENPITLVCVISQPTINNEYVLPLEQFNPLYPSFTYAGVSDILRFPEDDAIMWCIKMNGYRITPWKVVPRNKRPEGRRMKDTKIRGFRTYRSALKCLDDIKLMNIAAKDARIRPDSFRCIVDVGPSDVGKILHRYTCGYVDGTVTMVDYGYA